MDSKCQKDFEWGRQFLPYVKRVIGQYLITEAPVDEDAQHNTDLIVLKLEAVRIGVRIRKSAYAEKYADQMTIRAARPSGACTELKKIITGWGQYFFYGFAHPQKSGCLSGWLLGDLNVFRAWYHDYIITHDGEVPGDLIPNADGSSCFRAFNVKELPADFIVARQTNP